MLLKMGFAKLVLFQEKFRFITGPNNDTYRVKLTLFRTVVVVYFSVCFPMGGEIIRYLGSTLIYDAIFNLPNLPVL